MRIACLQFASQVGDIDNNINRADAVLEQALPRDLDLLVLPELTFSGFNFKSLQHINPYLEPTTAGISASWARATALKYNCFVVVGYPETVDITEKWPASPEYHNSALIVDPAGEAIVNYRKAHLYPLEEKWSLEGPYSFYDGEIPGFGNVVMGLGMDINPYKFEAPWTAWEFAYHIIHRNANLVIIPMAWFMHRDPHTDKNPQEPDMETLAYWLSRLEPVIRAEQKGEIIVVIANRCGMEGNAVYAGTSAVLGIDAGEVKVYGVLGCGENELLIIDTNLKPHAKLISDSNSTTLDYNVHSPITSNFEPPSPEEAEFPKSIDTILHATTPISPVEARFSHAYYDTQPPRTEDLLDGLNSTAQLDASHSASTSLRSSVGSSIQLFQPFSILSSNPTAVQHSTQSLISASNQPVRGKSQNSNRNRTQEVTLPQSRSLSQSNLQELQVNTTGSATNSDAEENHSPSSVSSMTTHTPWDKPLSSSREKVKHKTVECRLTPSPSPGRNNTPRKLTQRRPTPAPQVRKTNRTGRRSRTSRRHEHFEEAVPLTPSLNPAPEVLIAQIAIADPEEAPVPEGKKASAADRVAMLQGPSRGGSALAPRDEKSSEARPRSTVW